MCFVYFVFVFFLAAHFFPIVPIVTACNCLIIDTPDVGDFRGNFVEFWWIPVSPSSPTIMHIISTVDNILRTFQILCLY